MPNTRMLLWVALAAILYLNYDLDEIQRAAATVDFRLRPPATA